MKVKENPSLILAFHGMLGRKKQTSLLLILPDDGFFRF